MNETLGEHSGQTIRSLPTGACDCHAHVYGPFDKFPLAKEARFTPRVATIGALEKLWEFFSIDRAVLVQGSAYATDHRALLAAVTEASEHRRGVATVEPTTSASTLEELNANGIRGARINFVRHLSKGFSDTYCRDIARRIAPFGWHLELHVEASDLGRIRDFVRKSPVDLVIDHMGRVNAGLGLSQVAFSILRELLKSARCWVKLSGADRIVENGALQSAIPFARSLLEAAPDRVVWGTDWPHVNVKRTCSDEELFEFLTQIAPDDASRNRLLVENPSRLYGFESPARKIPAPVPSDFTCKAKPKTLS
jgi:2-pyrone-4,6-dicarboxylate lactonase